MTWRFFDMFFQFWYDYNKTALYGEKKENQKCGEEIS